MPHTVTYPVKDAGGIRVLGGKHHVVTFQLVKRPDGKPAHPRGMAPAPPLTHEEFVSLRDCAKGLMHRAIPAEHKDRLIN